MDKKQLSETDICEKFISPAIARAGWNIHDQIFREYPLRVGRVTVRGNKSQRDRSTVLHKPYARSLLIESSSLTTNMANVSLVKQRKQSFPLLSEAKKSRAVTYGSELCAMCADLRQRLSAAQSKQGHLAERCLSSHENLSESSE